MTFDGVSASPAHEQSRHEVSSFLRDVLDGLSRDPKELACKHFYDAEGSRLFERICTLDAYYVTRTERAILDAHIDEMAEHVGPRALLVEPGCGSGDKTRLLLSRLRDPIAYVPVDISAEPLFAWVASLRRELPALHVSAVHADFTSGFALPEAHRHAARRALFFPGSTIGNFTPEQATAFLSTMRVRLGDDARALIGIDLVKDAAILERAYDDPEGVTAAFNLNLLRRIEREDRPAPQRDRHVPPLDRRRFRHVAFYDRERARIEMHLESTATHQARIAGRTFSFRAGERIRTELSHKYTVERFGRIAAAAGFEITRVWTDPKRWFAVVGLTAIDRPARGALSRA